MKRLGAALGIIGLLVSGASGVGVAAPPAQAAPTVTGIAMTPAIQDKVLGPKEKTTSFSVQLANQTTKPVTFSISSNDFSALNQTGGLAFLGSDISQVTSGHGLSGILRLDAHIVTIPAQSAKTITATVDDLTKLAPGGHYTAILAQALPDGSAHAGNRVSINQVVSSLIFLETDGQGTKSLQLLKPKIDRLSFSLPSELNVVFKATGNTQTIPRGVVAINNDGEETGRGIINENSSLLLPGSTRLLSTPIHGNKHPLWPGIYQLSVQYRYEGSLGVTTYQTSFFYINLQVFIVLLAIILAAAWIGWRTRRALVLLAKRTRNHPTTVATTPADSSDKSHKS